MKDIQKVLEVVKDEINSSINLTQSQITGANIAITKIENLVGGLVEARVSPMLAEWISVDKRVPKRGQQVIWYHPEIKDDKNGLREYIRVDFADLPNRRASHWMPLPKPPKQ